MMNMESLKNFDWRSLQKFTSPQAAEDLNAFLEKLPQHAGQTMLIIASIAWAAAGGIGLYVTVQMQQLTELRAELQEAEALSPNVPEIKRVPVNKKLIADFVDKIKDIYTGLSINASGSSIVITAKSTAQFGQFREAIGHVQNGGNGWLVDVEKLCVGRACDKEQLAAALKINRVDIK